MALAVVCDSPQHLLNTWYLAPIACLHTDCQSVWRRRRGELLGFGGVEGECEFSAEGGHADDEGDFDAEGGHCRSRGWLLSEAECHTEQPRLSSRGC